MNIIKCEIQPESLFLVFLLLALNQLIKIFFHDDHGSKVM